MSVRKKSIWTVVTTLKIMGPSSEDTVCFYLFLLFGANQKWWRSHQTGSEAITQQRFEISKPSLLHGLGTLFEKSTNMSGI